MYNADNNPPQPEPPPAQQPINIPTPPARTLSGIGSLAISTPPPPPDDATMKDASESDKQTPDIPRKRQLPGDGISAESTIPYRDGSPEHPARRSKGQRPVSAPYGSTSEDIRRGDNYGGSRPSASRKLWTADQTTVSPRGNVDPSNVASIQARKSRALPPTTGVSSLQSGHQKSRSDNIAQSLNSDSQSASQVAKRNQRSVQDDTSSMKLQPETRPISQEQLVAEVKGIYAGLVMVEARCIEVDNKHATASSGDPRNQPKITNEQWQALIALHRTLLHEHHDFFLASQHPSASVALRRLASKYAMPARMWRHGIHSFLELLRHRLPGSIDHMLSFIYLAYSMMALLYETVPTFEDTWIECLGDLARYRMAIEEDDIRDREVWTEVARGWYSKASDKSPVTGRLYHHLAILARPDALQQLFYYAKSLCVTVPFLSARESILTLFDPILNASGTGHYRLPPFDTMSVKAHIAFVKAHGVLFTARNLEAFDEPAEEFLGLLDPVIGKITEKFKKQGHFISITNCAALLDFGSPDSVMMKALTSTQNNSKMEQGSPDPPENDDMRQDKFKRAVKLQNKALAVVLDRIGDPHVLPFIHCVLVWMLHVSKHPLAMELIHDDFPWELLSIMLNTLLRSCRDLNQLESDSFPVLEKEEIRPLSEDQAMRGLLWASSYFPNNWFSNQSADEIESYKEPPSMTLDRTERVLWLGSMISRRVTGLEFKEGRFSAPRPSEQGPETVKTFVDKPIGADNITPLEARISTAASATTMDPVERQHTWETSAESEVGDDVTISSAAAATASTDG